MVRGLPILEFDIDFLCAPCEQGKKHWQGHPLTIDSKIVEPLELLHIDLCGPYVEPIDVKKYVLVIVDDFSWFTWVFFLKQKPNTALMIINFIKCIKMSVKKSVRRIRIDNGTEF